MDTKAMQVKSPAKSERLEKFYNIMMAVIAVSIVGAAAIIIVILMIALVVWVGQSAIGWVS